MKHISYHFSRKPTSVPLVETKYRRIKTAIPCPGTEAVLSLLEKYESRSMQGQMPIVWDHAKDFSVFDKAGNQWIDFTSTIFVANVGHANSHVVASVEQVLKKPLLHTYAYVNTLRLEYVKRLIEFSNGYFEKAFLLSSGTEASEAVLKLIRMHGQIAGKRNPGIICIEGNYHGRTMGAHMMSVSVQDGDWVGYRDPYIHHIPFPYPWLTRDMRSIDFLMQGIDQLISQGIDIKQDICGFMLETFQGWGAVFYPEGFVESIDELCKKNGILLAFDEMQAGFARTGKRFGFEHYGVSPDLICCGKGMGGGFPLSGVLGHGDIMDLPDVGEMSSTHSANPIVCAAGIATLEEIEKHNLVSETERKGALFHGRLEEIRQKYSDNISSIQGKGLLAALLFRDTGTGKPDSLLPSVLSERCMQKGVLVVHTGRESIKLAPPLTMPDAAIIEGLDVIDEALGEIQGES